MPREKPPPHSAKITDHHQTLKPQEFFLPFALGMDGWMDEWMDCTFSFSLKYFLRTATFKSFNRNFTSPPLSLNN